MTLDTEYDIIATCSLLRTLESSPS